jgi:hypothetical protein
MLKHCTAPQVDQLLTQLKQDCMGQDLAQSMGQGPEQRAGHALALNMVQRDMQANRAFNQQLQLMLVGLQAAAAAEQYLSSMHLARHAAAAAAAGLHIVATR